MTKKSEISKARRSLKDLVYREFPYMLGHECGKPALYMKKLPVNGLPVPVGDVIYPNGSVPRRDDYAVCFSCKKELLPQDFAEENFVRLQ